MTKKEIDTKFEIAKILVKHLECDTSKVLSPLYDYLQEQLLIHSVVVRSEQFKEFADKCRNQLYGGVGTTDEFIDKVNNYKLF